MFKIILYEDQDLIVIYKPAGIATQTARPLQQDMVSELRNYLSEKTGEKNPYIGLVHRLDQPVTGLLVFAKNKNAAAALSRQITDGSFHKHYYAVVQGKPEKQKGRLINFLCKDEKTNRSYVVKEGTEGAKRAELSYSVVKTLTALEIGQEISLVEIELYTGRHHQIRVQMAEAGMPLLGDGKYGGEAEKEISMQLGCRNVALSAYKIRFYHPVSKKELCFEKQPEEEIFVPFFTNGRSFLLS